MPLVWPALGLALGLFAGAAWDVPEPAVLLLLGATAGGWVLTRASGLRLGYAALFATALLLGILRAGPGVLDGASPFEAIHSQQVELTGVVLGLPESVSTRVRFDLRVLAVDGDNEGLADAATVLVWADQLLAVEGRRHPYLAHGDTVTLSGRLDAPMRFGGFDYPEHLAARGVGSVLSNAQVIEVEFAMGTSPLRALHGLRRSMANSIATHVPEPQAALTQALLLGLRGGMPATVSDDFRRAGMAHLLAVSGMHVGLVLGLSLAASAAIFGRHRRIYFAAPLALVWGYVLLAGAPPSAVRAAAMGSVYLLALITGRASVPLNALGLAALIMLLWEPRVLWDRGFQLSFSAMAGVLVIGLPLWARVEPALRTWGRTGVRWLGMALLRWVTAGVLVSLGATLGSLPLVAFNFQQVPLLGIPATLLAMPLLPLLLISGLITAAAGTTLPPIGAGLAWLPGFFGWIVAADARIFASAPWATLDPGVVSARAVWFGYGLLAVGIATAHRKRFQQGVRELLGAIWHGPAHPASAALLAVAFAVVAAVPWAAAHGRPDGYLHIHFLDVGQGDATLLRTPSGATVLVDGGPDPRVTLERLDSLIPTTRPQIDLAVLTHPHADHLNGLLELARRGRIKRVLTPPPRGENSAGWMAEFRNTVGEVEALTAGAVVDLGDGVRLEVLHPPWPLLQGSRSDTDNNGLVVRVVFGNATVLLTGDLYTDGEQILVDSGVGLQAQVLKLGHHGSATSTGAALLARVQPLIAIVSAGDSVRLDHPAAEVVARVSEYVPEGLLFQTTQHGSISLTTDGEGWWVQTQR